MNRMTITMSGDCLHEWDLKESGIPGHKTVELYQFYPHAQHPRHQRIMQATMTPAQMQQIATWLWQASK